ncbi:MAG: hypothetical protein V4696_02150 [Pseudomonadota bacterium]
MIDEANFFPWLDGELSDDVAAEVARQVAADPELQRRADEHRALTAGLRNAFSPVADAPLPARLTDLVESHAAEKVVSLAEARERREARTAPLWKQMAAMAATLALGIVLGSQFAGNPTSPIQTEAGRLVAGAGLESALYTRLASAPHEDGLRIGMTFRDRSGAICRTFEDKSASGLACRDRGDWRIVSVFQASEGQGTDYRMAAGANSRLLEFVDEHMVGEPFSAAEERGAQKRDWR